MKLSILICSLPERSAQLQSLVNSLGVHQDIEILTKVTGREIPTGTKRNQLINESQGEYFSFIDDDDKVPPYYVSEMLSAISQGPDVVDFVGYMTTRGLNRENFTIKLGLPYETKNGHYYRYPNHLCAFKKSVVKSVRFQDIWIQEDYIWATEIKNKKLLQSEVHITKDMYHYDCWPKNYSKVTHRRA